MIVHVRFAPKADKLQKLRLVRFVPKADTCTATNFLIRSPAPSAGVEVVPVLNEVNANKA
jgi:hypothetical protein